LKTSFYTCKLLFTVGKINTYVMAQHTPKPENSNQIFVNICDNAHSQNLTP
jgi:hypothetical protein